MAHSTTPPSTPLNNEFPTAENRAIANFNPSTTLPETPNTTAEKIISLLPPMASLGRSKVPLTGPTATVPGIPNEAELKAQQQREEVERKKVQWLERYCAAQPDGRGMMSTSDSDYLEIMRVWRADQAKKEAEQAAEKKANEPVVKAITKYDGDMQDDGGVQMHRPSRAQQEQEAKKMRKREKAKKWFKDLV